MQKNTQTGMITYWSYACGQEPRFFGVLFFLYPQSRYFCRGANSTDAIRRHLLSVRLVRWKGAKMVGIPNIQLLIGGKTQMNKPFSQACEK